MDKEQWKNLFLGLEEEVNNYFAKKSCNGIFFSELDKFEVPSMALRTLYVVPKGLQEEDLSEIDTEFSVGLVEIGAKYGVNLRLPSWAYEK